MEGGGGGERKAEAQQHSREPGRKVPLRPTDVGGSAAAGAEGSLAHASPAEGLQELCPAPNRRRQPGTGLAPAVLNRQISTFPSPGTTTAAQPAMGARPCAETAVGEAKNGPLGGAVGVFFFPLCFHSNMMVLGENGSVRKVGRDGKW